MTRALPRFIGPAALVLLLAAACTGMNAARVELPEADKHVTRRIALMRGMKADVETLAAMASGRTGFDRSAAGTARRRLAAAAKDVPGRFRKPRLDDTSHARLSVWQDPKGFARAADRTAFSARALDTSSLPDLRRTLPALLQSCNSCHTAYRARANEFVTH